MPRDEVPGIEFSGNDLQKLYSEISALPLQTKLPEFPGKQGAPLTPIPIYSENMTGDLTRPFILRNFSGLSIDRKFFEAAIAAEPEIYGYDSSPRDNSEVEALTLPGAEVLARFKKRQLNFNIVDSECSQPQSLLTKWHSSKLKYPPSISWIVTLAPALTYFHVDPPYGDAFMFLCGGRKVWLLIAPEDLAHGEARHGFATVNNLPLKELLLLDDGFLWGRLHIGAIGAGDLIYFPQDWAHYVRTLEDSFGYGGYFGGVEEQV